MRARDSLIGQIVGAKLRTEIQLKPPKMTQQEVACQATEASCKQFSLTR